MPHLLFQDLVDRFGDDVVAGAKGHVYFKRKSRRRSNAPNRFTFAESPKAKKQRAKVKKETTVNKEKLFTAVKPVQICWGAQSVAQL